MCYTPSWEYLCQNPPPGLLNAVQFCRSHKDDPNNPVYVTTTRKCDRKVATGFCSTQEMDDQMTKLTYPVMCQNCRILFSKQWNNSVNIESVKMGRWAKMGVPKSAIEVVRKALGTANRLLFLQTRTEARRLTGGWKAKLDAIAAHRDWSPLRAEIRIDNYLNYLAVMARYGATQAQVDEILGEVAKLPEHLLKRLEQGGYGDEEGLAWFNQADLAKRMIDKAKTIKTIWSFSGNCEAESYI